MGDQIPSALQAGTSLTLRLSIPECPADQGWALRWTIQGPGLTRLAVEAVADGAEPTLALTRTHSLQLSGHCPWQLWATKGSESRIVGSGLMAVARSVEQVTPEDQVLADLEACLARLAQDDEAEVQIGDRTLKFRDPEAVLRLIGVYRAKVRVQRGGSPFPYFDAV